MSEVRQLTGDPSEVVTGPKGKVGPKHLPGDGAIWFCVLGDLIIFGAYFITYVVFRSREESAFIASAAHLSLDLAALNTLLLLASSWFIARGVVAARAGKDERAIRFAVGGTACGVLFIVVKLYEWWSQASRGFTLTKDTFFSFYYMLTGAHLLHVVIGLVILAIAMVHIRIRTAARVSILEQGATFWHMVDLLWVLIFALIYVMR
jgi:nitric oxide reductase NorE protein